MNPGVERELSKAVLVLFNLSYLQRKEMECRGPTQARRRAFAEYEYLGYVRNQYWS